MIAVALVASACALLCWSDGPFRLPDRRCDQVPASDILRRGSGRPVVTGSAVFAAVLVLRPGAFVPALAAGMAFGVAVWWDGRRRNAAPTQRAGQVAVACDLWAGCLDVGMPTGAALTEALAAVGGDSPTARDPTVRRLAQVAGLLRVGADVNRAWQPADGDPWLEPIAAAARRSDRAGADLATTVRAQGRAVRRAEAAAGERRAQRAGVLMTAPLTLCFLPAFVCLGLAPVVIALLNTLDLGR